MSGNIEEIEIRDEEIEEILNEVPNWMIRWGNMVFLSLVTLLLFISWFLKYPDIIACDAIITTVIPPQKEYAKSTGKLNEIFIADNQIVNKGERLAIIENTADFRDIYRLKSVIDTIKINNKTFNFPIDDFSFLFLGEIDSEFSKFEQNYVQYQLNKELKPFSYEAAANKYSILELQRRLQNLEYQREINTKELRLTKKNLQRYRELLDKGVVSSEVYETKQLSYAQTERDYKNFERSISEIKDEISIANKISKGTNISMIKEEVILLKSVIQSFNQLKNSIKKWEDKYVFKSNISGKVTFLGYWNKNQTVNQGDLIFTIIPNENSSFIAKLKTPSQNSGKIKKGQKVNIKLENFPESEFGMLNGVVNNVSLIPDEKGEYFVDVQLPLKLITSYNREIEFKQEMRGRADIITQELRLIERFFYQFKELLKR